MDLTFYSSGYGRVDRGGSGVLPGTLKLGDQGMDMARSLSINTEQYGGLVLPSTLSMMITRVIWLITRYGTINGIFRRATLLWRK